MKIIISFIVIISALLSSNSYLFFISGSNIASAQPVNDSSKIIQPSPQIRKITPPKPVINPADRRVISPGKTVPAQTGQQTDQKQPGQTGSQQPGQTQQPAQVQQTVQQPQYQEPIQQSAMPMMYTDTPSTYPVSPDQSYQQPVSQPLPDTAAPAEGGFTGVQSDMYRRTGGQGRGNMAPAQPAQQMPPMQQQMPQPMPQQAPMQPVPGQQDPQAMQGMQGMPQQQMIQQMPMPMQQGMGGMCTIQISEDRSSIALLDGSGQEINHIALGRDRVQKVFKSPDGNWNVLVFKVRQRQEYGAIAVNMPQCDPQEAREIRAVPENIQFQGDAMQLFYSGNVMDTLSLIHKTGP